MLGTATQYLVFQEEEKGARQSTFGVVFSRFFD